MKIINIISTFFLLGCCCNLTSCHDMDLFPQDQLGPDSFWKSEQDVEMGLTGVYGQLKNSYMDWSMYRLEGITDNAYCKQSSQSPLFDIQQGTVEASAKGVIPELYSGAYRGISACNVFLDNFYRIREAVFVKEEVANAYEAEVRFLRAYCYFTLVSHYGDIPLYKELPESLDAYKVKQSKAEDVYAFINEDLDFAIENLEDISYGSGHAVKATAQAFKARVALFNSDWKTVENCTKQIIDSGKYRLADKYESIFIKREGQLNNPEILFSINYKAPDFWHYAETEYYFWSALTPTPNLMDCYDLDNDNRVKSWYVKPLEDGKTWLNPFGEYVQVENNSLTGWMLLKHFDKNDKAIYSNGAYDFRTDNNIIIMRYADVLLMYAEAMLEQNGGSTNNPLALKCFNEIRNRAGIDTVDEITRDELRLERRREMAFEGLRHFDLVRWRIAGEVMNNLVTPGGQCHFEDRFYVWPFPQSEIDINPNLDQKEGY